MPEEKNMGNQGHRKEKAESGELSARLKKIREKREGEDKKKVLAAAAAAVAVAGETFFSPPGAGGRRGYLLRRNSTLQKGWPALARRAR